MPAMATDVQEFSAVPTTQPCPGESVGAKEYYRVIGAAIRKVRLLGRTPNEQEMLIGAGSGTPSVANGAQGSASSVVAGSSDAVGQITVTATVTPGVVATVTFATALVVAPRVVMLTVNTSGAGTFGTTAIGTTGFSITSFTAPTNQAYTFSYMVIP